MEVLQSQYDSVNTPATPKVLSQDDPRNGMTEARSQVFLLFFLLFVSDYVE